MHGPRRSLRDIAEPAPEKESREDGVGLNETADKPALAESAGGVAVERLPGDGKEQQHDGIVHCRRRREHAHIPQAVAEYLRAVVPVHAASDEQQHEEARRQGKIRLINAHGERQQRRADDPASSRLPREEPRRQHREQQRRGVCTADEHVAEGVQLRREGDNHSGKHGLNDPVSYFQRTEHEAYRRREKHQTHRAVQPRHGIVREYRPYQHKSPASGGDVHPLAEEAGYLVMVHELVGEGEHV